MEKASRFALSAKGEGVVMKPTKTRGQSVYVWCGRDLFAASSQVEVQKMDGEGDAVMHMINFSEQSLTKECK